MTKVFEKIERRGGVLKIVFELSSSFSFTRIRPPFNEGAKQAWLLFFNQIINMSLVQQCMFYKVQYNWQQRRLHALCDLHNSELKYRYTHP